MFHLRPALGFDRGLITGLSRNTRFRMSCEVSLTIGVGLWSRQRVGECPVFAPPSVSLRLCVENLFADAGSVRFPVQDSVSGSSVRALSSVDSPMMMILRGAHGFTG